MKATTVVVAALIALVALAIGAALLGGGDVKPSAKPPTRQSPKQPAKKDTSASSSARKEPAAEKKQPKAATMPPCRAAWISWQKGDIEEALQAFDQHASREKHAAVNTIICPEVEFAGRDARQAFRALLDGKLRAPTPLGPAVKHFSSLVAGSAQTFPDSVWQAITNVVMTPEHGTWSCFLLSGFLDEAQDRIGNLDPVVLPALEKCLVDVRLPLEPFSQLTHAAVTLVDSQLKHIGAAAPVETPEQALALLSKLSNIRLLWFAAKLPRYGGHYTSSVEKALTRARSLLLERAVDTENSEYGLSVIGKNHHALHDIAVQIAAVCFENEYIFIVSDEAGEEAKVDALQASLEAMLAVGVDFPIEVEGLGVFLNGMAVASSTSLAVLAAYRPLHRLPFAAELLSVFSDYQKEHPRDAAAAASAAGPVPDFIALLNQQAADPSVERELQSKLLSGAQESKSSDDTISEMISDMYEENPYPRWHSPWDCVPGSNVCGHPKSTPTYAQQLRRLVRVDADTDGDKAVDVALKSPTHLLFAGCGTGRQIALTSSVEPQTRITAFDLSTASLAYASRQWNAFHGRAQRSGRVAPVAFTRRNIMTVSSDTLPSFPKEQGGFDLIEVTGVLMILSDPDAGLANLARLLRSGGLIKIAVYSKAARAHHGVYAGRARIAAAQRARGLTGDLVSCNQTGILCNSSLSEIQKGRQVVIDIADAIDQQTTEVQETEESIDNRRVRRLVDGDFHSASDCRDLLFHPHERAYDLQELDAMISKAGLRFYGFDVSHTTAVALNDVVRRHKSETRQPWWHYWSKLEDEKPSAFAEMYQFWAVKP